MPIYEYNCLTEGCRHTSERITLSAREIEKEIQCSKCEGFAVLIVSRTARPRFSGSGFFETDYGRGERS